MAECSCAYTPPKVKPCMRCRDRERYIREHLEAYKHAGAGFAAFAATLTEYAPPIPMLLWCPACHQRHVDVALATKPHRDHACQHCGLTWRPAKIPTVGVQYLPGYKDAPLPPKPRPGPLPHLTSELGHQMCGVAGCQVVTPTDVVAVGDGWVFRDGYGLVCPGHAAELAPRAESFGDG